MKAEGHFGRCYLKGRAGDAANVVLSAVGHNFRRVLAWLRELLDLFLGLLWRTLPCPAKLSRLLNGRLFEQFTIEIELLTSRVCTSH